MKYDKLPFEGEYLKGKRCNWKSKEYNYDELLFDWKYLNGNRHEIGKLFKNFCCDLEFEGEYYKVSKKRGKEYIKGILIYEEIYLLDKKCDGKGYDID